jgi:conjugal transfer mating pair stabilization protein TraN
MFSSGAYTQGMVASMMSSSNVVMQNGEQIVGTSFASGGLSLGAYGFTFGTGAYAESAFSWGYTFAEGGYVAFNPYVFAAVVAIQVVQTLAQCEQSEQVLGMHKGQNLSVKVGETCVQKIPLIGTCIKWQEGWCSYNGAFAKILGTQGRSQLGLGLDSSCTGLTVSQLQQLNWNAIDFSEFTAQITAQATRNIPNGQSVSSAYNQNLNNTPVNGVNANTKSGLGYPSNYQSP